jgi:hypothetical protein
MKTSYFGNKSAAKDPKAVSIARWSPRWWGKGRRYTALAPSADLLKRAKAGFPWPDYIREYESEVLDKLDPEKVYAELSESILMCWEAPGQNCHRRLVAEWLEKSLKVKIPEL